jgi:hypothetical protein
LGHLDRTSSACCIHNLYTYRRGIYFKNFLNYKISVEKMVQKTVIEMVEKESLKDEYK